MATKSKKQKQTSVEENTIKSNTANSSWVYLVPVLLFTFIVFSPSLKNYFIINWDDDGYIINNPFLKNFSWNGVVAIFTQFHLDNYHPLTTLSNAIEYY